MDPTPAPSETPTPPAEAPHRVPLGVYLFCLMLVAIGCVYLTIALRRYFNPRTDTATAMGTYDVADEAKKYLREKKPQPLSPSLEKALAEPHIAAQPHPLLGKVAPEFTRDDVDGKPWALKEALKRGPAVVVFYQGYHCNHCV